jgi:hypothetical protein
MKIELLSGDPAAYTTLGDDADKLAPIANYRVSRRKLTQIRRPIGATSSTPFNRGNRLTTVAFAVTRTFATITACHAWIRDHYAECPDDGTLVVTDDTTSPPLLLPYAQVDAIDIVQNTGVSLTLAYQVTGSQFTPES